MKQNQNPRKIFALLLLTLFTIMVLTYMATNWMIKTKYQEASGLNQDLQELKNMMDDNNKTITEKIDQIDNKVSFLNEVCFG